MYTQISNTDDTINSQDVIDRIGELQLYLQIASEKDTLTEDELYEVAEVREELDKLEEFESEARNNCDDWEYGITLIHYSYFETYAEEFAGDIFGAEIVDAQWPYRHIDWEAAADELKVDYSEVEFDGETYYVR